MHQTAGKAHHFNYTLCTWTGLVKLEMGLVNSGRYLPIQAYDIFIKILSKLNASIRDIFKMECGQFCLIIGQVDVGTDFP